MAINEMAIDYLQLVVMNQKMLKDGFEFNDYEIIEMNADTVIIDDVEYRF